MIKYTFKLSEKLKTLADLSSLSPTLGINKGQNPFLNLEYWQHLNNISLLPKLFILYLLRVGY